MGGQRVTHREEVLNAALEATTQRNVEYGKPENVFARIAHLWRAYLYMTITETDVANMMILLKIARAKSNPDHFDNYVDIAGYAACGWDAHKEGNNVYHEEEI